MKNIFTTRSGKVGSAILAAAVVAAASVGVASSASAHDNKKPSPKASQALTRTHTPKPSQAAALKFVERQDVIITGSPAVGGTLTVSPGINEPVADSVTYQWQRNGVNIIGATATTYVVTADDAGKQIRVVETSVKASYKTEVEHSNRMWVPTA